MDDAAGKKIAEVADAMRSIVDLSAERNSATGYFAAMYLGVTRVVTKGLEAGIFTTPDRLATLTSIFAHRYLTAWEQHEGGRRSSGCWEVAFAATAQWRPTVIQHLLLGMNAHINLDLGVATAQVAPGESIDDLRTDFDEINKVLAGHVRAIQDELNQVSPLYRFIDDIGGSADAAVINFSIAKARDAAWDLATFLSTADAAASAARTASTDRFVTMIGEAVLRPGPISSAGLFGVRLTEMRSPAAIITVLSGVDAAVRT